MGFEIEKVEKALNKYGGDETKALNFLLEW